MYKLKIENLILKKDCNVFIKRFFDVSVDFFLLLQIHQETEAPFELAFLEKGTTLKDYAITLDSNNTRVLYSKNFEFELNKEPLEFSLILLGNYGQLNLNRTNIKKLIYRNEFINTKNNRTLIHQLLKIFIPVNILGQENIIKFDNSIMSIHFSLKTA